MTAVKRAAEAAERTERTAAAERSRASAAAAATRAATAAAAAAAEHQVAAAPAHAAEVASREASPGSGRRCAARPSAHAAADSHRLVRSQRSPPHPPAGSSAGGSTGGSDARPTALVRSGSTAAKPHDPGRALREAEKRAARKARLLVAQRNAGLDNYGATRSAVYPGWQAAKPNTAGFGSNEGRFAGYWRSPYHRDPTPLVGGPAAYEHDAPGLSHPKPGLVAAVVATTNPFRVRRSSRPHEPALPCVTTHNRPTIGPTCREGDALTCAVVSCVVVWRVVRSMARRMVCAIRRASVSRRSTTGECRPRSLRTLCTHGRPSRPRADDAAELQMLSYAATSFPIPRGKRGRAPWRRSPPPIPRGRLLHPTILSGAASLLTWRC
jgi:hypothetical protein